MNMVLKQFAAVPSSWMLPVDVPVGQPWRREEPALAEARVFALMQQQPTADGGIAVSRLWSVAGNGAGNGRADFAPLDSGEVVIRTVKTKDFEKRLFNAPLRQGLLPILLKEHGYRGTSNLRLAVSVLRDAKATIPLKVIALRLIGESMQEPVTLEELLDAFEALQSIGKTPRGQIDERLKEMVMGIIYYDLKKGKGTRFLQELMQWIRSGKEPNHPIFLPNRGTEVVWSLVKNEKERLLRLGADLMTDDALPIYSRAFDPEWASHWVSRYPAWPFVFGEMLQVSGSWREKAAQAKSVFLSDKEPVWGRAIALGYYSLFFMPELPNHFPIREGLRLASELLQFYRHQPNLDPILRQMGERVYHQLFAKLNRGIDENLSSDFDPTPGPLFRGASRTIGIGYGVVGFVRDLLGRDGKPS